MAYRLEGGREDPETQLKKGGKSLWENVSALTAEHIWTRMKNATAEKKASKKKVLRRMADRTNLKPIPL